MSPGAVKQDDLFLRPILGQNRLLEVDEKFLKLSLVGTFGQVHAPTLLETGPDTSDHRAPHLLVVLLVQHRVSGGAPAPPGQGHGTVRGLVHIDQQMGLLQHQVSQQLREASSLLKHPRRLVDVLAIHGLAGPEGDIVAPVELPDGVSADVAPQLGSK